MSDLVGRQASVTFAGITTVANGFFVDGDFEKILKDSTRFADVAVRRTATLSDGHFRVGCWIDSAATPALTDIQAGTASALTYTLTSTGPKKYAITSCLLERMHVSARANEGSPLQYVVYDLAQTAVTSAEPAVAT